MAADGRYSAKVTGLRDLQRAMRKAPPGMRKELRKAGKASADVVRNRARRDVEHKSGRLAGSVRSNSGVKSASVSAGGARAPYAGPINYGWPGPQMSQMLARSSSAYWRRIGEAGVKGIQGSHYLDGAAQAELPRILDIYRDDILRVLRTISTD